MTRDKTLAYYARVICLALAVFDLLLGGGAVLMPRNYASLFHPYLAEPPVDFIVRTGFIWLFFCFAETVAGTRKTVSSRARWFFIVGLLRLMDVPADLAYATLAHGAHWLSRAAIYSAPVFNAVVGVFLVRVSYKMRG
jgi:hypothetical protein